MLDVNLCFSWIWIAVGLVAGAALGVRFYDADWLGGYSSWPRRMVRLGHISFLGTGLLNLAFVFTVNVAQAYVTPQEPASLLTATAWLFLIGAVCMPLVCFLAAWRAAFRHLFVVPVASLLAATTALILTLL